MRTARGNFGVRRKLVKHFDIADEGTTRQRAFEQIVTKHRIGRNVRGNSALECIQIVQTFTNVAALKEYVLIKIRHDNAVRIEAADAAGDSAIGGLFVASGQSR